MADLFLSYCSRDRPRVADINGALEEGGYGIWWDRRLAGGQDYGFEIERELEAARCVLVAWSAAARESLWVRAEANEALDAGKLVQVSLDQSKLPLPFTMIHAFDFAGWRSGRGAPPWPELEARVAEMVGTAPPPAPSGDLPSGGLQGLGPAVAMGWGALGLAAVVSLAVAAVATGALSPGMFAGATLLAAALAALLLAATSLLTVRKLIASR